MKNKPIRDDDPLDWESDFSKARPNSHRLGVIDRKCVRPIEKDLAEFFPVDESANTALRTIADAAGRAERSKVSAQRASVATKRKDLREPGMS